MATKEELMLRFQNRVRLLEEEGVIDFRFGYMHSLMHLNGPLFFDELVSKYFRDTEDTMREMSRVLNAQVMDFHELVELALKMKGGSASLGVSRVASACTELRRVAESESRERCCAVFDEIHSKFHSFKNKVKAALEIDSQVINFVEP